MYALKRVIMHNERKDGFPITSIREVGILKKCRHEHCVNLIGVATSSSDARRSGGSVPTEAPPLTGFANVFLIFEYCEHDLSSLLHTRRTVAKDSGSAFSIAGSGPSSARPSARPYCPLFGEGQVKTLLLQLLGAVAHLHSLGVLHRDVKPSNILYNSRGERQSASTLPITINNITPRLLWLTYKNLLFLSPVLLRSAEAG